MFTIELDIYISKEPALLIFMPCFSVANQALRNKSDGNFGVGPLHMELLTECAEDSYPNVTPAVDEYYGSDEERLRNDDELDATVLEPASINALPPQISVPPIGSVVRRSAIERQHPFKYFDYEVTYSAFPQKFAISQGSSDERSCCQAAGQVGQRFNDTQKATDVLQEPNTYREAMEQCCREQLIDAINVEYEALMQNRTWIMTQPAGQKALRNKWVG